MKIILSTFVLSFLILSAIESAEANTYSYDLGGGTTMYQGGVNGYSYDLGGGTTMHSGDVNGFSYDLGGGTTMHNFR